MTLQCTHTGQADGAQLPPEQGSSRQSWRQDDQGAKLGYAPLSDEYCMVLEQILTDDFDPIIWLTSA